MVGLDSCKPERDGMELGGSEWGELREGNLRSCSRFCGHVEVAGGDDEVGILEEGEKEGLE